MASKPQRALASLMRQLGGKPSGKTDAGSKAPKSASSRNQSDTPAPAVSASEARSESSRLALKRNGKGDVVLELKDIRKEYEMGGVTLAALDGIDLTVRQGEKVAIMGPSGSGKSTMLHILGLLDRPTSGELLLDGVNINELDDSQTARIRGEKIGFVFQSFFLIPTLKSWENVALPMMFEGVPLDEREKRAKDLLGKVGLGDRADHLPSELSGGQRQRVAIARSLANNPSLILADEPTGNLDSKSGQDILNLFDQLHRMDGRTLIIVTHDPGMAKHVERVIRLKDGRVESDGAR